MSWRTAVTVMALSFTATNFATLYRDTPQTPIVKCIGRGGNDGQLCVKWAVTQLDPRTVKQEDLDVANAECHVNCASLDHQKCWAIDVATNAMNYTCVDEDWFPSGTLPLAEFEALRLQTWEGRADNDGLV
ncbi:hypothetical protein B0A48_03043 [Cryoendolithus antarcticus]|uniref:Apple domain-containing protein n=1 Tax=Cryoendolithus antarcticus TaxID=1507870 RepID=A0A1V8TMB3_9PEZI|nr:hypothetical protein B0A48_03043 [Cryoendolithus antarcticus]